MSEVMSPAGVRGGSTPIRRAARGSICRTTCGSLRVRVYAGRNPITGRQRWLSQNIPAGPAASDEAEAVCRRLLSLVHHRRHPRVDVTVAELLDRHLTLLHASETTRRSNRWTVAKHVGPLLGHLRLTAVTPDCWTPSTPNCGAAATTATTHNQDTSADRSARPPSARSTT